MWNDFRCFLSEHVTAIQGIAAAVQALAAVVSVVITVALVVITRKYTLLTQAALKLGREQFEREWTPNLHIRAVLNSNDLSELEVTNLGRMSVVVTKLLIRFPTASPSVIERLIPRPFPLSTGARDSVSIMTRLSESMHKLDLDLNTVNDLPVDIRFDYTALGTPVQTEWFHFSAEIVNGRVCGLDSA
jgi:hypothetical protein